MFNAEDHERNWLFINTLPDRESNYLWLHGTGWSGWDQQPIIAKTHVPPSPSSSLKHRSLATGINYFDHADIYTFGKAEQVFGQVLAEQPSSARTNDRAI